MTFAFVCRDPVVNASILPLLYSDTSLLQQVGWYGMSLPTVQSRSYNSRLHTARVSQDCIGTVTTLPWPARSPDLSQFEHIWDHLKRGSHTCFTGDKSGIWQEMEVSENDVGSLEQLLLYADEPYIAENFAPERPFRKGVHGKGAWIQDLLLQGVWKLFAEHLLRLRLLVSLKESQWNSQVLAARSIDPLSSRSSWSFQTLFPRVGTFSCHLLPTISKGTLRTINLAYNTARRPACSFLPDDQASLKFT
ncbi:hypothetical protein TNCV_1331361 [Trichonephila clavipes]|nr:hypothetical protein TNCV_1331361 [Trichonephila clavipes]